MGHLQVTKGPILDVYDDDNDDDIYVIMHVTLTKNATKPNPFEIIPLQTARKENNWKTEEAMERAAVTVETERIEGSDP